MKNLPIKWWQDTVFYEVYISSFQDGNNDGIGDFKGLTRRLDYFKSLGINGLWITPFYPSPKVDNGYDVADYRDVDSDFGTLADFDLFIAEAHKRDIKVIIDVVLNHVSSEHAWFKSAISDVKSPYRDYFIFQDTTNNWESFFGGTAWHKEPNGNQYYYHQFAPEQVDLNWQNPAVKAAMVDNLKFWLDRGVDGFRFDVINFLTSDGIGQDNPFDEHGEQLHVHDIDQASTLENIKDVAAQVRAYAKTLGKTPFLVGEVGHEKLDKLAPYQGQELLDVVFNFNLGSVENFELSNIYQQLVAMEEQLNGLPTIFFNSHDMPRSMSRLCNDDVDQAKALAALSFAAKGVNFLYFGEEIGMPNYLPENMLQMRDIQAHNHFELAKQQGKTDEQAYVKALSESRDKSRLYMQWDNSAYAGFSQVVPWIGSETTQAMPTVSEQTENPDSLWHWYQKLIHLRQTLPALKYGEYQTLALENDVITIERYHQEETVKVLINFSANEQNVPFSESVELIAQLGFEQSITASLKPYGVLITKEDCKRENR